MNDKKKSRNYDDNDDFVVRILPLPSFEKKRAPEKGDFVWVVTKRYDKATCVEILGIREGKALVVLDKKKNITMKIDLLKFNQTGYNLWRVEV